MELTANLYNIYYKTVIDKKQFRDAEVKDIICDYSKAKKEMEHKPQYPLTETIKNIVEYHRT